MGLVWDTCFQGRIQSRLLFSREAELSDDVPEIIEEVLEESESSLEDIDYFVLHQANRRIIEAVAKRLKTDISKFPMNLEEYANTSAATVPILIDEMNRKGMFRKGQKIMMAGFGAGLTWAASLFEW